MKIVTKHYFVILFLIAILIVFGNTHAILASGQNGTTAGGSASNIFSAVNEQAYYLHQDAILKFNKPCINCRALALGTNNGIEVLNLIKAGWFVQAIEREKQVRDLITSRARLFLPHLYKDRLHFLDVEIERVRLRGKFDYVFAFFSVPFGDKKKTLRRIRTLGPSMKRNGLLALNFFGEECDFVKKGLAFAIDEDEIHKTFRSSGYEVIYLIRRTFKEQVANKGEINWDIFDVIVRKK